VEEEESNKSEALKYKAAAINCFYLFIASKKLGNSCMILLSSCSCSWSFPFYSYNFMKSNKNLLVNGSDKDIATI
jgi:hypothetical protein